MQTDSTPTNIPDDEELASILDAYEATVRVVRRGSFDETNIDDVTYQARNLAGAIDMIDEVKSFPLRDYYYAIDRVYSELKKRHASLVALAAELAS